jgi:uncharacterized protein YndB with AHSA1/START domain
MVDTFEPDHWISGAALDGVVTEVGGGLYDVRYERHIPKSIDRVWAAITEPARLEAWLAQAKVDLRVGGVIELYWPVPGDGMKSRITELDPPRLFAFGWPEPDGAPDSIVRFELSEEPGGCRLVLTNTLLRVQFLLSVATGWHTHLDQLPAGAASPDPQPLRMESWNASRAADPELIDRYRAKLPREAAEVELNS